MTLITESEEGKQLSLLSGNIRNEYNESCGEVQWDSGFLPVLAGWIGMGY